MASLRKVLAHPDRNGYLYVIDRATRRGALGECLRPRQHDRHGVDLKTGRPHYVPRRSRVPGRSCAISARMRRWQGLAAFRLLTPDPASLHAAPESLSGRGSRDRQTTLPARPMLARTSRCTPGPGGNRGVFTAWDVAAGAQCLGDQGKLSRVEWRASYGRGRCVLRHHGRVVQSRRRTAAASCCGSSKPAPESSGNPSPTAAPTGSSTSPFCPVWAVGPALSSRAISTRAMRVQATAGRNAMTIFRRHAKGRHAVCLHAALNMPC